MPGSTAKTRFKTMVCRVCEKPMQVGSNTRNAPRCIECGLGAATQSMIQMKMHSGPYYDQYLAGMRAYAIRMGWAAPSP